MFTPALTPALAPALALLPDFALILLGASLRRVLHLGDHFWTGLEKLVYYVLFPALLFNGLVKTRIDWAAAGPLLAVVMGAMATGMVLGYGARMFRLTPMSFASQYQCAFRFNLKISVQSADDADYADRTTKWPLPSAHPEGGASLPSNALIHLR